MAVTLRPSRPWFGLVHRYAAGTCSSHHAVSRDCLALVLHAEGRLRSIVDGRETRHDLGPRMVGIVPPDGARHTVVVSPSKDTEAFLVLLPSAGIADLIRTEGLAGETTMPEATAFFDEELYLGLEKLRGIMAAAGDPAAADETLRSLLVRLVERRTGRSPDWKQDARGFDPRTLGRITAAIDDRLRRPPSLVEIAAMTGYSPSHCARKIRLATGLSLNRLCNHRRIQAALTALRDAPVPMAALSLVLGFSSQSHFNRVFTVLTGMTPAKYRHGLHAVTRQGDAGRGGSCRSRRGISWEASR